MVDWLRGSEADGGHMARKIRMEYAGPTRSATTAGTGYMGICFRDAARRWWWTGRKVRGVRAEELERAPKNQWEKQVLAWWLRQRTTDRGAALDKPAAVDGGEVRGTRSVR
jgi:hypothetical protein